MAKVKSLFLNIILFVLRDIWIKSWEQSEKHDLKLVALGVIIKYIHSLRHKMRDSEKKLRTRQVIFLIVN